MYSEKFRHHANSALRPYQGCLEEDIKRLKKLTSQQPQRPLISTRAEAVISPTKFGSSFLSHHGKLRLYQRGIPPECIALSRYYLSQNKGKMAVTVFPTMLKYWEILGKLSFTPRLDTLLVLVFNGSCLITAYYADDLYRCFQRLKHQQVKHLVAPQHAF